jgi:hypothetical protein
MRRNSASDDCFRLASRLRPRVHGRRPPRAEKAGRSALRGALFVAVLWASACDSKPPHAGYAGTSLTPPGPGVIFSYPRDGQYDVPVGTRLVLTFSDALPELTFIECAKSGDQVTGTFCVEGIGGLDLTAAMKDIWVRLPGLPLYEAVRVGDNAVQISVNPVVAQIGLGLDL